MILSLIAPIGKNNEHPGYTDVVTGQQHVADLVEDQALDVVERGP